MHMRTFNISWHTQPYACMYCAIAAWVFSTIGSVHAVKERSTGQHKWLQHNKQYLMCYCGQWNKIFERVPSTSQVTQRCNWGHQMFLSKLVAWFIMHLAPSLHTTGSATLHSMHLVYSYKTRGRSCIQPWSCIRNSPRCRPAVYRSSHGDLY